MWNLKLRKKTRPEQSVFLYFSWLSWLREFTHCFGKTGSQIGTLDILPGGVQSLSRVRLCTLWTAAHQVSLSFTISWSWLKLMSTESMIPSSHLILSCPLLLPSIFPNIRVFSSESALRVQWSKCKSFSFSFSPSDEYTCYMFLMIED